MALEVEKGWWDGRGDGTKEHGSESDITLEERHVMAEGSLSVRRLPMWKYLYLSQTIEFDQRYTLGTGMISRRGVRQKHISNRSRDSKEAG